MAKPLGIVPLYYGIFIHPNDHLNVVLPPSQFAKSEVASLSRKELEQLVISIDQEMKDGRRDLFFLRGFWEDDFSGKKKQDSLKIEDLEAAVKGELTPEGRRVVADLPAYNLIRLPAFTAGAIEFQKGRKGVSQSVSHFDLLSVSIKSEESGVGKEAKKYWDVTVRAPFLEQGRDILKVNEAYEVRCQCRAHLKQIAKDTRIPPRSTAVACSHIASALRELYLEKEGTNQRLIHGLEASSLISDRGEAVMPFRFYERRDLALEMIARRYVFGQELSEIDSFLRDEDIFSPQFQKLRESGQARIEVVRSTQNFPEVYGGIKEEMVRSLDQHGYEFAGYGYDFRGTRYKTVALVFMNPKNKKVAHIIFDGNIDKPLYLFKMSHDDLDLSRYSSPVERLNGNPINSLKVPFVHVDDMLGKEMVGLVISPESVLKTEKQKELYLK